MSLTIPPEFAHWPLPSKIDGTVAPWALAILGDIKPEGPLAQFLAFKLIDAIERFETVRNQEQRGFQNQIEWMRTFRFAEAAVTRAQLDWHRHIRLQHQTERHERQMAKPVTPKQSKSNHEDDDQSDDDTPAKPGPFDKTNDIFLDDTTPINWEDHIVFNPKVSRRYPVIKGTEHTADGIAGMIDYGWSNRTILEQFEGITVDDLRAVFAADAVQMCGPWPEGVRPQPQLRTETPTQTPTTQKYGPWPGGIRPEPPRGPHKPNQNDAA